LNRIAIKYLITILYAIVIVGFTFNQGLSYSTPAYKLYVYNLDKNNGYRIRLKNEETRWSKSVNIEGYAGRGKSTCIAAEFEGSSENIFVESTLKCHNKISMHIMFLIHYNIIFVP